MLPDRTVATSSLMGHNLLVLSPISTTENENYPKI